jgi:rhomboid protease GluP
MSDPVDDPTPSGTSDYPAATASDRAAPATLLIIAVNVLVFAAMAITGAGVFSPDGAALVRWGADFGSLTLDGQWWRMLTALFVHIGLLHLVVNMAVLVGIGTVIEAAAGTPLFAAVYLAAGVGGSAASLAWHPFQISAGASGAIFGLYGAFAVLLMLRRREMPDDVLAQQWKSAVFFVGYNLLYGLARPEIDMAAHVGGLLTGFAVGLLALASAGASTAAAMRGVGVAVVATGAIIIGSVAVLPKPDDVQPDVARFADVEDSTLTAFNSSINQWKSSRVDSDEMVRVIEQDLLPKWRSARDALARPRRLSPRQQEITDSLVKYIDARTTSWSLLAEGIRRDDVATVERANEKMTEAEQLAKALGEPAKP